MQGIVHQIDERVYLWAELHSAFRIFRLGGDPVR